MTTDAGHLQIPLVHREPAAALRVGPYVAALQNRKGELDALRHASVETWRQFTPIIHLVGRKRATPLSADAVREQVRRVADAVGAQTVYLDVLRQRGMSAVATPRGDVPLLQQMYLQARSRGMRFLPVAHAGESDQKHVRLVSDAALEDGRGVAVRYRPREVIPPARGSVGGYLGRVVDSLGVEIGCVDLLIDLEYMDPDVEIVNDDIAGVASELMALGEWRNVVLLGTSIPSTLGEIKEGTMGSLPRREWDLWTQLRAVGLARTPWFGDYAIQSPLPPDGGGPGMRANIRYTVDDKTIVVRGHGSVIQEGKEQYRELCQQLVGSNAFAGGDYTWGDRVIQDCASGRIPAGAQNMWRGAGTSHHLRFVTDQLQRLRAAS
jgi:hypothetical protein